MYNALCNFLACTRSFIIYTCSRWELLLPFHSSPLLHRLISILVPPISPRACRSHTRPRPGSASRFLLHHRLSNIVIDIRCIALNQIHPLPPTASIAFIILIIFLLESAHTLQSCNMVHNRLVFVQITFREHMVAAGHGTSDALLASRCLAATCWLCTNYFFGVLDHLHDRARLEAVLALGAGHRIFELL